MSLRTCLFFIAFGLLQAGLAFPSLNSSTELNESTLEMIANVFKKDYPQAAIDKFISVVRQCHSKIPEEKEKGNFEAAVLLLEGALHQTFMQRILSGNIGNYDVRSILDRKFKESDSNDDSAEEITEKWVEQMKVELAEEFPTEVVQRIYSILTRFLKLKTAEEAKKVAIDLTILSMDGARVVTSKPTKTMSSSII